MLEYYFRNNSSCFQQKNKRKSSINILESLFYSLSSKVNASGLCAASAPVLSLRTRYWGSSGDALTWWLLICVSEVNFCTTTPSIRPLTEFHWTLSPFLNSFVSDDVALLLDITLCWYWLEGRYHRVNLKLSARRCMKVFLNDQFKSKSSSSNVSVLFFDDRPIAQPIHRSRREVSFQLVRSHSHRRYVRMYCIIFTASRRRLLASTERRSIVMKVFLSQVRNMRLVIRRERTDCRQEKYESWSLSSDYVRWTLLSKVFY